MDANLQTFSNAFSQMKTSKFKIKLHWNVYFFSLNDEWVCIGSWWHDTQQVTSHNLNQYWFVDPFGHFIYTSLGLVFRSPYSTLWSKVVSKLSSLHSWNSCTYLCWNKFQVYHVSFSCIYFVLVLKKVEWSVEKDITLEPKQWCFASTGLTQLLQTDLIMRWSVLTQFFIHCKRTDLMHNAPIPYPTMHHFVTEMCTHVHFSVTKWCIVVYLSDALWDLWNGPIAKVEHGIHKRHPISCLC